jgi:acyl CoA:acetate/3-ketoacid CoA transferase
MSTALAAAMLAPHPACPYTSRLTVEYGSVGGATHFSCDFGVSSFAVVAQLVEQLIRNQ